MQSEGDQSPLLASYRVGSPKWGEGRPSSQTAARGRDSSQARPLSPSAAGGPLSREGREAARTGGLSAKAALPILAQGAPPPPRLSPPRPLQPRVSLCPYTQTRGPRNTRHPS